MGIRRMLKTGKKPPAHIYARQQLLNRMAALSTSGVNSLPPERELCAEFGVSLNTVKKAIRQLTIEGRLASVARKGHFIRAVTPETNIGIIIGEGSISTFLREPCVLGGIIDVLTRRNCFVRIIQLSKPKEASDVFNQYKIDGCIWYLPHALLFPKISKIIESCKIPIVVPFMTYTPADVAKLPPNHFTNDFVSTGRVRAEYLISRGHRNIVHCAGSSSGTGEGFAAALNNAGLVQNPDWILPTIDEIPERLPGILDTGKVTAIISEGGLARFESVFRILNGHPWSKKGELLVDFIGGGFAELRKNYPGVNISAVNSYPARDVGRAAAEALVDAVKDGVPIQSMQFSSQINGPEWTPYYERISL